MSIISNAWKVNLRKLSYIGIISVFFAAIFEAFGDVAPKYFLGNYDFGKIEPVWLVLLVFLLNFLFFSLFQKRKKEGIFFPKTVLIRKNILMIGVIGIIDSSCTVLFFYGLKFSNAINGTIFGSTEILFGVFLSVVFLQERIKKFETIPIILILTGSVIIPIMMTHQFTAPSPLNHNVSEDSLMFGNVLIVVASLVMSFGVICYKKIPEDISTRKTIQSVSLFGFLFMSIIAFIFAIPIDVSLIYFSDVMAILFMAVIGFGLPVIFYLIGIRKIGAIKTVIIFSSTTAFGIIFSNLILSEVVQIENIISVVLIIVGGVYVIDYESFSAYYIISFFTSCVFALLLYRLRFVGMGDVFAIISIAAILPVHYEFVMISIISTTLALIIVVFVTVLYNFTLNVMDLMSTKRKSLFSEFVGESLYRKFLAVFFIHRKRRYEKFVISGEKHYPAIPRNRSFVLISRNKEISQTGGFVQNAPPFVVFMMIGIVLLLFPDLSGFFI